MDCPKCRCEEISSSGMCLWCGYQINAPAAENKPGRQEKRDIPGKVEMNGGQAPDKPAQEELPQSRREISQRPAPIKQERPAVQAGTHILPSAESEARASKHPGTPSVKPDPVVLFHTPSARVRRPADPRTVDSLSASLASPPESKGSPDPKRSVAEHDFNAADSPNAQGAAKDATSEQSKQRGIPAEAQEVSIQPPAAAFGDEGRRILLSRAFSGLADLIIMALSTGALIIAAHLVLGMRVLDSASRINWFILFMLVYFMYSLLFIGISNQTIGMMIMNLQVVVRNERKSPQFARILMRCCGYLVSLLCLGIGLLWALLDSEHQCLHDRLTNTRVVRVSGSRIGNEG
jgi:uncharacterized RDD family membrane protein YckC